MLEAGGGVGVTLGTGRLGLLLLLRTIRVTLTADVAMVLYKEFEIDERRDVQRRKVCIRKREGRCEGYKAEAKSQHSSDRAKK